MNQIIKVLYKRACSLNTSKYYSYLSLHSISRHFILCIYILIFPIVICGFGEPVYAETDIKIVNNLIKDKLNNKNHFGIIYSKKTGKSIPKDMKVNKLSFKGKIISEDMEFMLPSSIPRNPIILRRNELYNCNETEVILNTKIEKTSLESHSWKYKTGINAEVSCEWQAKAPLIGESKTNVKVGGDFEWEKGTQISNELTWEDSIEVHVGSKKIVETQFIIQEEKLDNILFSFNLILEGSTDIEFEKETRRWWCVWLCKKTEIEPVEINIEDFLASDERKVKMEGIYSGVTAVDGNFRVGSPRLYTGCDNVAQAMAVGASVGQDNTTKARVGHEMIDKASGELKLAPISIGRTELLPEENMIKKVAPIRRLRK